MPKVTISANALCDLAGIKAIPEILTDQSVVWDVTLGNGQYRINCTSEENARALVRDISAAIARYGMELN